MLIEKRKECHETLLEVCVYFITLEIHTHTHNRFTAGLEYVRVHPDQQVPER